MVGEFEVVGTVSVSLSFPMKINCSSWMKTSAESRARETLPSSAEGQRLFISTLQVSEWVKQFLTFLTSVSNWVAPIWGQLLPGDKHRSELGPGG